VIGIWLAITIQSVRLSSQQPSPVPPASPAADSPSALLRSTVSTYCVGCHNQRLRTAEIALDGLDVTTPATNAEVWERVIRKLRAGSMPPGGRARPSETTYRELTSYLETEIDKAAAARPNPGRTNAVHRLTRTEYQNAIRDLLALDLDVASLLPGDDTSDSGFDNNADVLTISTSQLDRYMSAARKVSRLAVGLPPADPGINTFEVPLLLVQDDRLSEDLPLGSRGGVAVRHNFPVDGEYLIKVRLRRTYQDYIMGMGMPQELDVRIDGRLIERFTVGGEAKGKAGPASFASTEFGDPEWEEYLRHADDGLELRTTVKAGPRLIAVSFVRGTWEPEGIPQPQQRGSVLSNDEIYSGNAAVGSVEIGGPYRVDGPGDTPSRREVFVCQPRGAAQEQSCAATILTRLARRAFRRPIAAPDLQMLLRFYESGRKNGGSFDTGIQFAVERLIVDPSFLLRVERDPEGIAPGDVYRLADLEIASRLSFFIWSSIPDEPLLDLAERGQLTSPTVLVQQVRRMLSDRRAGALVENFAAQWLHLRRVTDVVGDPVVFPHYDDNLVHAFKRESELFLTDSLREDRSVVDLLSSTDTFVNERLARHYGIEGIYGSRFRRITLPDSTQRGGLLGQAGFLALSSYPNRTSPVLRGKWLLDTILGVPPPAPPPNVPDLPERGAGGRTVSVRERLEQHRQSPVCASCHATIDPLGFALENFDALGGWRAVDEGGKRVDASGVMPSGASVDGLTGLRAFLVTRREQFVGTVTEKLLAYALGRGLEHFDQPTVRKIVSDAETRDYRWSSLIEGIVKSPAFLLRRAAPAN
jgi:hypothetical protein